MKKALILLPFLALLVGCGVTKIDLPEPTMEIIRKSYPEAVSGYIVIKTKPKKEKENE